MHKGRSALSFASENGDIDNIKKIVDLNADLNQQDKDKNKRTPMLVASQNEHPELIKYFLGRKEVDVNKLNKKGNSPLYYVCARGDLDMFQELIEKGADVNAPGCLNAALNQNNLNIAEAILKNQKFISINEVKQLRIMV